MSSPTIGRAPRGVRLAGAGLLAGTLAATLLSETACAVANDETPAEAPAPGHVVPADDAGDAASVVDEGGAPPSDPCAVGNVCRVSVPLAVGYVSCMSGRSTSDVWAGGSRGALMHWDGKQWSALASSIGETLSSLSLTADEAWGVAGTLVVRRGIDASTVRTFRVAEFMRSVSSIALLPNGDAYLSYLPPYVVDTWPMVLAKITDFDRGEVSFEPDPVLAESGLAQAPAARALFVVPGKALWLVGNHANVARYPLTPELGAGVVMPIAAQADLLAAWGVGDHLWAAGTGGTILHFDGAAWSEEDTGTNVNLNAIHGFGEDDIWAAGDEGTVLHFDGARWSRVEIAGYRGHLRAVWGASPDDVWFGGERAMFHWGPLP